MKNNFKNNGVIDMNKLSAPTRENRSSDNRNDRDNNGPFKNTTKWLEKNGLGYIGGAAGIAGGILAIITGIKKLTN